MYIYLQNAAPGVYKNTISSINEINRRQSCVLLRRWRRGDSRYLYFKLGRGYFQITLLLYVLYIYIYISVVATHGWGHLQFKVARSTLHIIVLVPAAEK